MYASDSLQRTQKEPRCEEKMEREEEKMRALWGGGIFAQDAG
jgi:hypothetical protein